MLGDYLDGLRKSGSSIGAVIEVVAEGVPPGLGAPIYGKLDGDLAAALMSINAVKGVEIGAGFGAAELTGEENGDEMRMGNDGKPLFLSNNAGGILGGISTGQPVVARFAVKPTSSILNPRRTVDRYGHETEISTNGRHDPCVGIRAVPIGEAMVACVIADHYLRQRGQVGETPAWPFAPPDPLTARTGQRSGMEDAHQRIHTAIAAFARGEIVIVADDDDRENEGDLFVAASLCTPEKMAFIIRHTSGIVCAPLAPEEARRLHLDPMVALNDAPLGTAFTVSVDVRHGLTTGISAEERTNTVRALANGNTGASDFVRPGHVFPLVAKEGGVLDALGPYRGLRRSLPARRLAAGRRAGRTDERRRYGDARARARRLRRAPQAAAHLDRRADRLPAGARQADRARRRISGARSEIGTLTGYAFLTPFDPVYHMAFVYGRIGDGKNVLTRLHRANIISDVFGGAKPIHQALARFKAEGRGVLVLLRDGTAGVPGDLDPENDETASGEARTRQWREVGLGAQILKELGVNSIRLLTSSRRTTYVGLSGFGIEIVGTEPVEG